VDGLNGGELGRPARAVSHTEAFVTSFGG
jgi:hypothetical protein